MAGQDDGWGDSSGAAAVFALLFTTLTVGLCALLGLLRAGGR